MATERSSLLPGAVEESQLSNAIATDEPPLSFWHLVKHGVVLKNEGSTARDHLANERTYLAWIRTSLALVGASIGLLKWDAVGSTEGYMLGIIGVTALVTSTYRYFRVMERLERNSFEPNVRSILAVVVIVAVCFMLVYVLPLVKPTITIKAS